MTEDNRSTLSSSDTQTTKPRRKRKWDDPAMPLVSAGLAGFPGFPPLVNAGIGLPGVASVPFAANGGTLLPGVQAPLQQLALSVAQKPKIQDELVIAKEIVINDAESATRYKLTKRQTQEEIQKCTGAVVITRGKYRPPNAPPDCEKPLYLHISAGSHLESTVDRIKAVDHAAAMVEEILKLGSINNVLKANLLSTSVYMGFEADPSLNLAARIRGPNDQYINHIMNETGATVLLRGRGSGSESTQGEEGQLPLHLLLSSHNPKSLEQAKLLAENLLDTISAECGSSRVSSSKVYGAVPPPPQIFTSIESSVITSRDNNKHAASSSASSMKSTDVYPSVSSPGLHGVALSGTVTQSVGSLASLQPQTPMRCYPQSSLDGGSNYNVYAGIYPQATPLQQVALALKQSSSPLTATVSPITTSSNMELYTSAESHSQGEKRLNQKRKFQELPVAVNATTTSLQNHLQGLNDQRTSHLPPEMGARDVSKIPPLKNSVHPAINGSGKPHSKNLVQQPSNRMPPPPPKLMPPPASKPMLPPPPRLNASSSIVNKTPARTTPVITSETVPDTLVKLMEYGDDDDDDEDSEEISAEPQIKSSLPVTPKPFWAA